MSSPHNTEPQVNGALARALVKRNPDWTDDTVHAERTNVIRHSGKAGVARQSPVSSGAGMQPDILIASPHRQPIIVETEFAPAPTVDQDAINRLRTHLRSTGTEIEGVLSVVLPESLKFGNLNSVESETFKYATFYLSRTDEVARWPASGKWLEGGVDELADAVEYLSLSERRIERGTDLLELVVSQASERLKIHAGEHQLKLLADKLHQEAGVQTNRMVSAILVSAYVFHAAIEDSEGIPPMPTIESISKWTIMETWGEILEKNYWPIFSIARELVNLIPTIAVSRVMRHIAKFVSYLADLGATTYHDLTGRMFQTLISDRKFLATFYTLPESACLLAELAVKRLDIDWSDSEAIKKLRIADFACGTGTLLSAAQRAVYRRYRRAGGNDKDLQQSFMEDVLVGLDIMPAATHLTCSMLSSCYPTQTFGESLIHTMPYGIEGVNTHLGALDLLESDESYSLFSTGETLGGTSSTHTSEHSVSIKDNSCDLVIMNPPFTRPTNHESADVPVPSFAGFNKSEEEQKAMSTKLKRYKKDFGHGNAGLASNFMDLGHRKLKRGGTLALVVPFTFAQGKGWEKARKSLSSNYTDINILSLANTGQTDRAFSADTGMAECLIVATKSHTPNGSVTFTNLKKRPSTLLEASIEANKPNTNEIYGTIQETGCAGVLNRSIVQTARDLQTGQVTLPRLAAKNSIPMVRLGELAKRGLGSRDISDPIPRGAFDIRELQTGEFPEYPVLWGHKAELERSLIVSPDSYGEVRSGCLKKAVEDWNRSASRLHWNIDFQLNSQSLMMCITPEKCLGGSAWPNVLTDNDEHDIPLLLWCNSTFGLLMHWWKGTRQQLGRSRVKISAILDCPVLDLRQLSEYQTQQCKEIFEDMESKNFLPANEAYRDSVRQQLDRSILCDVLRISDEILEPLAVLRKQWCAEPSVHGGKDTRIKTL